MEITTIIWVIMLGAAIATLTVYYNSHFLGTLVRALIKIDATSVESALTLKELGVKLTLPLKYALRPDTSFSNTVIKTEDGRYYIKPEKVAMAKAKYRNKDTSALFVLISILILAVGALAMAYIFPEVIESFNNQVSELFGDGGSI